MGPDHRHDLARPGRPAEGRRRASYRNAQAQTRRHRRPDRHLAASSPASCACISSRPTCAPSWRAAWTRCGRPPSAADSRCGRCCPPAVASFRPIATGCSRSPGTCCRTPSSSRRAAASSRSPCSPSATGDTVALAVSDTGIGIAPEFLGSVFDRFRQADSSITRQHGGLGIGLAVARELVELHGGTIRAASAGLGQGARFEVRLPRLRPGTTAPPGGRVEWADAARRARARRGRQRRRARTDRDHPQRRRCHGGGGRGRRRRDRNLATRCPGRAALRPGHAGPERIPAARRDPRRSTA